MSVKARANETDAPRHWGATPDAVAKYARTLPCLSREEQDELAQLWVQNNDEKAITRLFFDKVRLILWVVDKYNQKLPGDDESDWSKDDLIGIGYQSFLKAVKSYTQQQALPLTEQLPHPRKNPDDRIHLNTYIMNQVNWDIYRNIQGNLNPFPFKRQDNLSQYRKSLKEGDHSGAITAKKQDRLLQESGIAPNTIYGKHPLRRLLRLSFDGNHRSLNPTHDGIATAQTSDPSLFEEYERNLSMDRPCDPAVAPMELEINRSSLQYMFYSVAWEFLTQREIRFLELRYGLRASEPMTLEKVGDRMGVTGACVRLTEARALEKLRRAISRCEAGTRPPTISPDAYRACQFLLDYEL